MKKKIGTAKRAIPCEKISTTTPPRITTYLISTCLVRIIMNENYTYNKWKTKKIND